MLEIVRFCLWHNVRAHREAANCVKGIVLKPLCHVNCLALVCEICQLLHKYCRCIVDLILYVRESPHLVQGAYLASSTSIMFNINGAEYVRFCAGKSPR